MKILIVMDKGPVQRYLVKLCQKTAVEEVKYLTNGGRYSEAAAVAFTRGNLEEVIFNKESRALGADLILTKKTANWDLTK